MTPLRVLILEDSEAEAALLVGALGDGGYAPAWERVETAAALAAAVVQIPAAVVRPWISRSEPSFRMAPAPRKPIPVAIP